MILSIFFAFGGLVLDTLDLTRKRLLGGFPETPRRLSGKCVCYLKSLEGPRAVSSCSSPLFDSLSLVEVS